MLSGSSSNTTVVPNANIVFGGSGANRTVTVTPAANRSGTATITVTVSDGQLSTSDTFKLTVVAVNDAPTISAIADQTIAVNGTTGPLRFTVGDVETAAGSLTVSGSSNNTTLVPNANIAFGGSGANRTVTVTPAANQTGNATITVTVSDGQLSTNTSFVTTVNSQGTGTQTFTNVAAITIPTVGVGTPYPSAINVTGMGGTITDATLTLNAITHGRIPDLDILLVSPSGQTVIVLSDVGSSTAVSNVTLALSDSAPSSLGKGTIVSGTYKPTNFGTGDTFPAPAPPGPYRTKLATFNRQSANGTWSLYVLDDKSGQAGSIGGGWSLTITTAGP
jgi:subtilisin-like proprotein convertase family protein